MESNNPCRLIASLLSSTFFLTVLAASNARAEDLPLDSPHFGAEASGTSVAVALANAVQQIIDGSVPSSESTLGDDRAQNTAQSEHAIDPDSDIDWEHCGFDITDPSLPLKLRVAVCAYPPPETPESPLPEKLPTTREILYSAAAVIVLMGLACVSGPTGCRIRTGLCPRSSR